MRLENKTAIVTGGASGLGYEIAVRFIAEGARVVVADIEGAQKAAQALQAPGARVLGIPTDVASWTSVEAMVDTTVGEFGAIDILVNNAAISSTIQRTPFEELTTDQFARMLAVNTIGTFHGCKAVSPYMRKKKAGRIINMASGTAFRGSPFIAHYVASKGAVISLTRSLAHELGPDNITVNAISPGFTLTENLLQNRTYTDAVRESAVKLRAIPREAHPPDLVGAVVFLASEDAGFITGQILAVDGGAVYH